MSNTVFDLETRFPSIPYYKYLENNGGSLARPISNYPVDDDLPGSGIDQMDRFLLSKMLEKGEFYSQFVNFDLLYAALEDHIESPNALTSNSSSSDQDNGNTCVICLMVIGTDKDEREDVLVRVLGCGHVFHKDCIDPWWLICRDTCPYCQSSI